jgi:site-specific recombinase XerD
LAATVVRQLAEGPQQLMAPATVNNHLAHLSAFFTWTAAHAGSGLLPQGDPTKGAELLPLPAPEPRALSEEQVRTVKNVLDRLDTFHRLKGRRHQGAPTPPSTHRHARPMRDRAITHVLFATGLRRTELVNLDLTQLHPHNPIELRRVKKARLVRVRGKGRTQRTVFLAWTPAWPWPTISTMSALATPTRIRRRYSWRRPRSRPAAPEAGCRRAPSTP